MPEPTSRPYYVYLLRCADDTLYCGVTPDIARRLAAHNSGKGAKYTRARRPVEAVYLECQPDRASAQKREYAIKRLTRQEKLEMIEEYSHERPLGLS